MPAAPTSILIIEDDRNTAALLATYLEREGFATRSVHDGAEALALARRQPPDFVILDVMLPQLDGWEICRALRALSDVPILMLTAREEEIDRVLGLSLGADDYVVKPFSPRELVARVKAILRRARPTPAAVALPLCHAGLTLDSDRRRVDLDGAPVELTAVEFKLLQALMRTPGKVFSRDDLLNAIYAHGEAVVDRVVDVHIGHLRQKLGDDPANPRFILTVRGFGYRFADREDA